MLAILQFIFQDFWHWLGSMLLIGVVVGGVWRTIGAGFGRIFVKKIKNTPLKIDWSSIAIMPDGEIVKPGTPGSISPKSTKLVDRYKL